MFPRFCARFKVKYIILGIITIFLLDFFGVFTHMFELDYYRHFRYPMEGDVLRYARQVRFNLEREVEPINFYNYTFLKDCRNKCYEDEDASIPINPKLIFLVKSEIRDFDKRNAIRKTWGYEKRFSDVLIRTVFIIGVNDNRELQKHIEIESDQYHDIVQANFIDSYFNNTIKTMIGFKWALKFCSRSQYFMFVDDDYYVSSKNVLRFIKNPNSYPAYLEEADETLRKLARRLNQSDLRNSSVNMELIKEANKVLSQGLHSVNQKKHYHQIEEYVVKGPERYRKDKEIEENNDKKLPNSSNSTEGEKSPPAVGGRNLLSNSNSNNNGKLTPESKLFAGFVFTSSPHRHKSSKWHVTLAEYPYHMWPPYVTAGAFLLSREALYEMYYVSMYTKHFRFDDIYLGIVALKAGIEPFHCEEFYFHKAIYTGPYSYRYVIASHGYNNPEEMVKVWIETKAAGHA